MKRKNIIYFLLVISILTGMVIAISCSKGGGDSSGVPDNGNVVVIVDIDNDGYDSTVDCNDNDEFIHPGASDSLGDGVDSNCDGVGGEPDNDGDGYGLSEGDCDDTNPGINPKADEICSDGIDQNCNGKDLTCNEAGSADEDNDFDGYSPNDGDCDDTDPAVNPGETEICGDDIDQNCDGLAPSCDNDGDGFSVDEDCDDNDETVHPGAVEDCTSDVDKNCDGYIYECDLDLDGDGFTISGGDCNDLNPSINPDAIEGIDGLGSRSNCTDGIDNNCNHIIDLEEASCNEPVIGSVSVSTSNCTDGRIPDGSTKQLCGKYDVGFTPSTISVDADGATYAMLDDWKVVYREYRVKAVVNNGVISHYNIEWTGLEAHHLYDERPPYSTDNPYAYPDYFVEIYDADSDSYINNPLKYDCTQDPAFVSGSEMYLICYDSNGHKMTLLSDSYLDSMGEQFYFAPFMWHCRTTDVTGRWDDAAGYFSGEY